MILLITILASIETNSVTCLILGWDTYCDYNSESTNCSNCSTWSKKIEITNTRSLRIKHLTAFHSERKNPFSVILGNLRTHGHIGTPRLFFLFFGYCVVVVIIHKKKRNKKWGSSTSFGLHMPEYK